MASQIKNGHTYKFTNTTGGLVLETSMADFKSIAGMSWNNSDNQKWVAERGRSAANPTRWAFRSVATGLYLGIEGPPRTKALIVATRNETEWDVRADREDPSVLRIVAPDARLSIQLEGRNAPSFSVGAPATLLDMKDGDDQRWRFELA